MPAPFRHYLAGRLLSEMPTAARQIRAKMPFGHNPADQRFLEEFKAVLAAADDYSVNVYGPKYGWKSARRLSQYMLPYTEPGEGGKTHPPTLKDKEPLLLLWRYSTMLRHADEMLALPTEPCPYRQYEGQDSIKMPPQFGLEGAKSLWPKRLNKEYFGPDFFLPVSLLRSWVESARQTLTSLGFDQEAKTGFSDLSLATAENAYWGVKDRANKYQRKDPSGEITINPKLTSVSNLNDYYAQYASFGYIDPPKDAAGVVKALEGLTKTMSPSGEPFISPENWAIFTSRGEGFVRAAWNICREMVYGYAPGLTPDQRRPMDPTAPISDEVAGMALNSLGAILVSGGTAVNDMSNSGYFAFAVRREATRTMKNWFGLDIRKMRHKRGVLNAGMANLGDYTPAAKVSKVAKSAKSAEPAEPVEQPSNWTATDVKRFLDEEGKRKAAEDYPDEWKEFHKLARSRTRAEQSRYEQLSDMFFSPKGLVRRLGLEELKEFDPDAYEWFVSNIASFADDLMQRVAHESAAPQRTFADFVKWRVG